MKKFYNRVARFENSVDPDLASEKQLIWINTLFNFACKYMVIPGNLQDNRIKIVKECST